MKEKLLKATTGINSTDLKMLREKYVLQYSKEKGWDPDNLSPSQLLEIVEQKKYKNPLLLS